jgi:hypothetical protein
MSAYNANVLAINKLHLFRFFRVNQACIWADGVKLGTEYFLQVCAMKLQHTSLFKGQVYFMRNRKCGNVKIIGNDGNIKIALKKKLRAD